MGYRYSEKALSDLQGVIDYILRDNPRAALAVTDEIEHMCDLVASMPGIGHKVEFISKAAYFMVPAGKYPQYLIFYEKEGDDIVIHRIVHSRRNLTALFDL
ncbi:MAG TPA: type II toxin-antitoxin system RelE/ParE family toxin [Gammaproteobacteria bacterium]|nr:type II toxin-antitoxin system RelE/ParE family toxin [Gammaproteobacteria bacterium]